MAGLAAEINKIKDEQARLKSENEQLKLDNASSKAEVKFFKSEVHTEEKRAYWLCELSCIR